MKDTYIEIEGQRVVFRFPNGLKLRIEDNGAHKVYHCLDLIKYLEEYGIQPRHYRIIMAIEESRGGNYPWALVDFEREEDIVKLKLMFDSHEEEQPQTIELLMAKQYMSIIN